MCATQSISECISNSSENTLQFNIVISILNLYSAPCDYQVYYYHSTVVCYPLFFYYHVIKVRFAPVLFDRIVLCSGHRAPFVTYSVLKYHKENQEAGQEGMRYYVMH